MCKLVIVVAFFALTLGLAISVSSSPPVEHVADVTSESPVAQAEFHSLEDIFVRLEQDVHGDPSYRDDGDNRYLLLKLVPVLERQAREGKHDAQFKLGAMYLEGVGVRQDLSEAIRRFSQAGGSDHPLTQLALGKFCLHCRSVDVQHGNVRKEAIEALGKIGPAAETAIPLLDRELNCEWPTGYEAATALGRIGGRGVAILIAALESKDVGFRRMAASGLEKAGEHARPAESQLTAALNDDDQQVREFARRALARMGKRP